MVSVLRTWPAVPSWNEMFIGEAMTFKLNVAIDDGSVSPHQLCAQDWCGQICITVWHAIDLIYDAKSLKTESSGRKTCEFSNSFILKRNGEAYNKAYRFTFRVKVNNSDGSEGDRHWIWASGYKLDGKVKILPSTDVINKPEYNHIFEGAHLGNFMASSIADELGFESVLNVADNLDLVPSKFSRDIYYKKVPMRDGQTNQIPDELIREAVAWLTEENNAKRKILVNCRAGKGRSGSTMVAFVFSQNPTWTFEEAEMFVDSRRSIYSHHKLKESLYKLYPRRK